jgi:hypothetical protein
MNKIINKLQEQFDKMQAEIDRLTNDKMHLAQQLFAEQAKAIDNTTRNTPREMLGKTALSENLISLTKLPPLQHEDNI